jgi:hypothetical protein
MDVLVRQNRLEKMIPHESRRHEMEKCVAKLIALFKQATP